MSRAGGGRGGGIYAHREARARAAAEEGETLRAAILAAISPRCERSSTRGFRPKFTRERDAIWTCSGRWIGVGLLISIVGLY